jgi:hypothetical protein
MNRFRALPLFLLLTAGCSTAVAPVNMKEPRRVVGTESAVRIDAVIPGDELRAGVPLPITYEITNNRSIQIAVADIIPETIFDLESNTLTVNIGSEIPGETLLPRLIAIGPGEKKTFSTTARVAGIIARPGANPDRRPAVELRLKVNFLGDTTGFNDLIEMTQKALADSKRANEVFNVWLERNEAVYTNSLPMRFLGRALDATTSQQDPSSGTSGVGRRRGRRG